MTKSRSVLLEILRNLLLLAFPYMLLLFAEYSLAGGRPAVWRTLLLLPLFFLTLPLRRLALRIWQLCFLSTAYVALLFFLGLLLPGQPSATVLSSLPFLVWAQPVFFALFALFAVIVSVYEKVNRPVRIATGYLLLTEALMFFLYLNTPSASFLRTTYYLLACLLILLFITYMQMGSMDVAMRRYAESGQQPVDRISRAGNRMLAVFLGLFTAVILLAPYGAVIVNALLNAVLAGIRFITGKLNIGGVEYEFETFVPDVIGDTGGQDGGMPEGQTGWLGQVFFFIINVVLYLAAAAVAVLVLYFLGTAIYRFYKRYYAGKATEGDVRIDLKRTSRTSVRAKRALTRKHRLRAGFLARPADRVRRMFITAVERSVRSGSVTVRKADTARIISTKIEQARHRDLSLLTSLYEKARYGPEGSVQDEDVRRARRSIKRD